MLALALLFFLVITLVTLGFVSHVRERLRHIRLMRERAKLNYDWYREQHPNLVKSGKVECYKCSATNVQVRIVRSDIYLREHACGQCGETLYFSTNTR